MMSIQPVQPVPLAACPPVRQDPRDTGGHAASATWRCALGILLALCLLAGGLGDATADGLAGVPPSTRPAVPADGDEPAVPVRNIVEMTLAGPLEERAAAFSAFAGVGRRALSMGEVLGALERARVTPDVAAVVLRLTGPQPALAQVQALRRKVAEVRAAGKKVFCLLSAAGHAQYLLAAAADRIAIVPAGSLNLVGLSADVYFLKDLLDTIGVQMDLIQTGAFKGAAEPFTRTSMSPESRRNLTSVLDDQYGGMVADVAKGRGLTPKKVKALIDNGPYSAREALKRGLVDWVAYPDQFDARVKAALKGPTQFAREPFGRRGAPAGVATNPLALMSAMLSMLSPPSAPPVSGRPRVAVIYVTGPIVTGESDVGLLGGEQAASGPVCRALRRARRDDTVHAVVLRVNSPGGSVLASDLIWRDVGECARVKPVIASFGDLAASGGYYVSAPATAIVAEAATITGSIGVVGGEVVRGGLYAKLGIRRRSPTTSAATSPG